MKTIITKGLAVVTSRGIRCAAPRRNQPLDSDELVRCNKLLCMFNPTGQIAGSFKCERCGELIEVETA